MLTLSRKSKLLEERQKGFNEQLNWLVEPLGPLAEQLKETYEGILHLDCPWLIQIF